VQEVSPVSGLLGVVAVCCFLDGCQLRTVDTCQAYERKSLHASCPRFLRSSMRKGPA